MARCISTAGLILVCIAWYLQSFNPAVNGVLMGVLLWSSFMNFNFLKLKIELSKQYDLSCIAKFQVPIPRVRSGPGISPEFRSRFFQEKHVLLRSRNVPEFRPNVFF